MVATFDGAFPQTVKKDSFTPPQNVQAAAKKALKWMKDGKAGDGFTPVGRKRASDLANGHPVSMDTLKRMKAYFDRHQPDKKSPHWNEPSPGKVAWYAWGGDAGYAWAKHMVASAERVQKSDVEGHPFHGNQWTGGEGSAEGALLTGDQVKSAIMSPQGIDKFNSIMSKQGYLTYPVNHPLYGGCGVVMKALQNIYPNGKPVAIGEPITPEEGEDYPPIFVQHYALQIGEDKFVDGAGVRSLAEIAKGNVLGKYWQVLPATPDLMGRFQSIATCTDQEAKDYANVLLETAKSGITKKQSISQVANQLWNTYVVKSLHKGKKPTAEQLRAQSQDAYDKGDEVEGDRLRYLAINAQFEEDQAKITKGDKTGHTFHGNQWTGGIGGAEGVSEARTSSASGGKRTTSVADQPLPQGWKIQSKTSSDITLVSEKGNTAWFATRSRGWKPGERISNMVLQSIDKFATGKIVNFIAESGIGGGTVAYVHRLRPDVIGMGKYSVVNESLVNRAKFYGNTISTGGVIPHDIAVQLAFERHDVMPLNAEELAAQHSVFSSYRQETNYIDFAMAHEIGHSEYFTNQRSVKDLLPILAELSPDKGGDPENNPHSIEYWNKAYKDNCMNAQYQIPSRYTGITVQDGLKTTVIPKRDWGQFLYDQGRSPDPGAMPASAKTRLSALGVTEYGREDFAEMYAEMYAAYQSPRTTDIPLAQAFAKTFGWTRSDLTKSAILGLVKSNLIPPANNRVTPDGKGGFNVAEPYVVDTVNGPVTVIGEYVIVNGKQMLIEDYNKMPVNPDK